MLQRVPGRRIGLVQPDHAVVALGCRAPRAGDELAQIAPALQVVRQHHHGKAKVRLRAGPDRHGSPIRHRKLRPRQQLQAHALRLAVRAHHPRHRALVGDGQRRIAQLARPLHQFFRLRGATLEAETREAMQLGVGRRRGSNRPQGLNRLGGLHFTVQNISISTRPVARVTPLPARRPAAAYYGFFARQGALHGHAF